MMAWLIKKIVPRLMRWALTASAVQFRDDRGPEFHAKATRRYLWDNVFCPVIRKWRDTPGEVDDVGADFIYFEQAGYIEDGTLAGLIRKARHEYLNNRDVVAGSAQLQAALDLIETNKV